MSGYDCRESSDNFGNPTRSDRDTIARLMAERDELARLNRDLGECLATAHAGAEKAEARAADAQRRIRLWRRRALRAWISAENIRALVEAYESTTGESVAEDEDEAAMWCARRSLRSVRVALERRDVDAVIAAIGGERKDHNGGDE